MGNIKLVTRCRAIIDNDSLGFEEGDITDFSIIDGRFSFRHIKGSLKGRWDCWGMSPEMFLIHFELIFTEENFDYLIDFLHNKGII